MLTARINACNNGGFLELSIGIMIVNSLSEEKATARLMKI